MEDRENMKPGPARALVRIGPGVVAAVLAFAVFLPTFGNGFVNWDDQVYIYENRMIRSLDWDLIRWAFTTVVSGNWHPLTLISHAVDYALWGLDPRGHHLSAVILHSAATFLVYVIVRRLVSAATEGSRVSAFAPVSAFVAAVLFGLHPMHVESVAWASERKDLLCALFYLLSVAAYLGYARGTGRRAVLYAAAVVSAALALMSKPMAVSLPVTLLIIDYYPLKRFTRAGWLRAAAEKIPFVVLSGAASAVAILTQGEAAALRSFESSPLFARILTAARGYVFYIYKMFVPTGLSPFYPRPDETPLASLEFGGALVLVAAVTALAVYIYRSRPWFTSGWAYYLFTLLPVIGIVQVGAMAGADRYFYLPSVAPFALIGLGGAWLWSFARSRGSAPVVAVIAAGLVVASALSYQTVRQIGYWRDSVSLWSRAISIYPESVPLAYVNRGIAYGRMGMIGRAHDDLQKAVEIKPDFVKARYNLANALDIMGRKGEAITHLTEAIRYGPGYTKARYKRGTLYLETGRPGAAVDDLRSVVAAEPGHVPAYMALARAYAMMGDDEAAAEYMMRARELGAR